MNEVAVDKKRNVAVVGQHGSGKTSLIEAILYHTGEIDRLGNINDGNTYADYLDEEKDKKHTISSKVLHCSYNEHEINFIDTPGYSDFIGDIEGALHAADGALIVINAQSGVEVELEKIWDYIVKIDLPHCVVINKMDAERADFDKVIQSMEDELDAHGCPVRLPYGKEESFKGVIDLITDKALLFNEKGGMSKQEDIPGDLHDWVEDYRGKMIESAVSTDDALTERYLEGETISFDEIRHGLHDAEISGDITPVFVTSATKCIGISSLLDGIVNIIPNPLDRKKFHSIHKDSKEVIDEEMKTDGPGLGFVFKSYVDPFAGKIALIRMFSGSMPGDSEWHNHTKDLKEKVGHLLSINGKKLTNIPAGKVGDIVAVAKIDTFDTNDTVSNAGGDVLIEPPTYPQPPIYIAIHAADRNDEDKLGAALSRLVAGDPTIKVARNTETKENVINCAGQMQVDLLASRIKSQFKLDVELTTPKVAYRETITSNGEGMYRHKKQSGGRGQFAEVHMRFKPLQRGEDYEFLNNIFGGSIPTKYVPAVEKGIVEARERGIIAGYPVVDVSVDLFDGKFHDVDSSEMAFKIAASMCFRDICKSKCKPILLEPIMDVQVFVPEDYMGDVMGDMNSRRGRVMGMEALGKKQVIKAKVPLAEMYAYTIDLRSITHGRGWFEMQHSHYEQVPSDITEKVVAASKVEDIEDA